MMLMDPQQGDLELVVGKGTGPIGGPLPISNTLENNQLQMIVS